MPKKKQAKENEGQPSPSGKANLSQPMKQTNQSQSTTTKANKPQKSSNNKKKTSQGKNSKVQVFRPKFPHLNKPLNKKGYNNKKQRREPHNKQSTQQDEEPKIPTERDLQKLQDRETDKAFFDELSRQKEDAKKEDTEDKLRLIGDVRKYIREGVDKSKRVLREEFNLGKDKFRKYEGVYSAHQSIRQARKAALDNARAEILFDQQPGGFIETEEGENVWEISQKEIKKEVAVQSARKAFDLALTQFGPYKFDYSRNGRWILLAGRKGHLAMIDSHTKALKHEVNVKDVVRHAKFLHNETMYAVAQKNYVFVYDENGAELHRLKAHDTPLKLDFLPYHFLLVSVSKYGRIVYQDVSTGGVPFNMKMDVSALGAVTGALKHNPYNAVVGVGHSGGVVSLWAPSGTKPLVTMLCHKGPVRAIAYDRGGNYMVTSGQDHKLRIWDIRNFQLLNEFACPPTENIDVSQMKVLAVGLETQVKTYENVFNIVNNKKHSLPNPYIVHKFPGVSPPIIADVHFCPYEDVLGIGTSQGFTSILVPGSGDPNYDSWEADPYQTVAQRQEHEVKTLLEKIQPAMISLDPNFIASINPAKKKRWQMRVEEKAEEENEVQETEELAESWAERMERNRKLFEQGQLPNIEAEADKLELQMLEKDYGNETQSRDETEEFDRETEINEREGRPTIKKKKPVNKGVVTKPHRLKPLKENKFKKDFDNNRTAREPDYEVPTALDRFKKKPRKG